jgi:hypothetical protein
MLRGSCQCGQVEIEVDRVEPVGLACCCSMCRKISGAATSPVVLVARSALRVAKGKRALSSFASSDNTLRYHCGTCHAPIYADVFERPDFGLFVPAGIFDEPAALAQVRFERIFASSLAPWHQDGGHDQPRHEEGPPIDRLVV